MRNIVDIILSGEKITEDEAKYIAYDDYYEEDERFLFVKNIEGESHRWTRDMTTIFLINDEYWALDWGQGLTEFQEDEFWNSQPYRVKKRERVVTITDYIPLEGN